MVQFADNLESALSEAVAVPGVVEAVQEQKQLLWSPRIVHLRADITGLDDAIIHFGLLQSNPLPDYQFLHDQGGLAIDTWVAPFGALRIDQIFFLCAYSSLPHASTRVARLAGLSLGIASPGDEFKRWLTTFPLSRQGEWVAWCVEIDMRYNSEKMKAVEIVLSEENMLLLK